MNEKSFFKKASLIFIVCLVFAGSLIIYSVHLEKKLSSDIYDKLKNVSESNSILINNEIKSRQKLIGEAAARIADENSDSTSINLNILNDIITRYDFKRMGIINKDGIGYATDGYRFDYSGKDFFNKALNGEIVVSGKLKDVADNDDIIIFCAPVYINGNVKELVFAAYSTKILTNLLYIDFFEGNGCYYITDKNGNIIITSAKEGDYTENIYDSIIKSDKRNNSSAEDIKYNIDNGIQKQFSYYNNGKKYMYYLPLNINDWYIFNEVNENVIAAGKNNIMHITYVLFILDTFVFAVVLMCFIKNEKSKNLRLREIAYVDPLTGGYTYQRFIEQARESIDKNSGENIAFAVMDIDGFKFINELYGYDVGDEVLKYIWQTFLNEINAHKEVFARKNADRFVALLYYDTKDQLRDRLKEINAKVQNCYIRKSKGYILRPKMGIYLIENKKDSLESMYNYAIMAYSTIKTNKDDDIAFYSTEYSERIIQNKFIEDEMEYAYENKEFMVYYQPKYDALTKRMTGAEALVRWKKHSTGELVSPGIFIPIAEKNGFVIRLDEYVFKEVCIYQKRILSRGTEPVPVSVNVSQKHFYNDDFVKNYVRILNEVGIDSKYIQIEITESAMFENRKKLCSIMDELHDNGFKILMDDFGTGYSSLMMLKSISVDIMKLDKSFVDDYNDKKGEIIIRHVVQLAKQMDISIIAEGVETQDQYIFLRDLGCDHIQGYYFARPMPEQEYTKLLTDNLTDK